MVKPSEKSSYSVPWDSSMLHICFRVQFFSRIPKPNSNPVHDPRVSGRFDALVAVVRSQLDETNVLAEGCTFASSLLDFDLLGLKAHEYDTHCWEGLQAYAAQMSGGGDAGEAAVASAL